jgi:SAM-dependent methyltransferase
MLLRRLAAQRNPRAPVRIAVLGCSNGAEVYSIVWAVRSGAPQLAVTVRALDISADVLAEARAGVYARNASLLARMTPAERAEVFDLDGADEVRVKPWLKEGITWHVDDAAAPDLPARLGLQDVVVANNFLCHMPPAQAEPCLRSLARLVVPGGHLMAAGVDLDVRTRVARQLGWTPVLESIEEIHGGDPSVRRDWPCEYWGLEPIDKRRRDWQLRYACVFQLGHIGSGQGTGAS